MKWFNSLPRLVQIILLFIPFVNWVVEVIVRWSAFVQLKKNKTLHLVVALVVTIFGVFCGILDAIWCLLFKHMFLA